MKRVLVGLGFTALLTSTTLTSVGARSATEANCFDAGGGGQREGYGSAQVHDARDKQDHMITFELTDTPTAHPDGCHHQYQAEVFVSDNRSGIPFLPDNGPPFDGARLNIRVWICGVRHPEDDISTVVGSSNDARSQATRELNYGHSCSRQVDNYRSEAHSASWTPNSVSAYTYITH
jgi:hypothetical protein